MALDSFPLLRCPVCGGHGLEERVGLMACPACGTVYPVLDRVPLLLADVPRYFAEAAPYWLMRNDLSAEMEDRLGGLMPPGSYYDVSRQHLSSYARDHYGQFDAEDTAAPVPGGAERLVRTALAAIGAAGGQISGPCLDLGCATGGVALMLADEGLGPVAGVDLSAPLLRMASRTADTGEAVYPRRRGGTAYERRRVTLPHRRRDEVQFILGDGLNPPLAPGQFGLIVAMNIIDCVADPLGLIARMAEQLRPGGFLIAATPFDWSASATPPEAWTGSRLLTDDFPGLAALLAGQPDLQVTDLQDHDWAVRLHDRAMVQYRVALAFAQRKG